MRLIIFLLVLLLMCGMAEAVSVTITANVTCNGTIYAPCPGMPVFDPVNLTWNNETVI